MAYIYRYTDLLDNVIKYVEIVCGKNRTLNQRIKEHSLYDNWCKKEHGKYQISIYLIMSNIFKIDIIR